MRVTMSLLVLLGVLIALMLRFRHKGDGLTFFEFLLCGAFGFLLASSSIAPTINRLLSTLAGVLSR
jgi:hypothetical protein